MNPTSTVGTPDIWVTRHAHLVPSGPVLDLACGRGRHGRYFLNLNYPVTFLDKDTSGVSDLIPIQQASLLEHDLEQGNHWPFQPATFTGIIVTNYLYRPLFPKIMEALQLGGLLIYKTFAVGNEQFGSPRNPDFLLKKDELKTSFSSKADIINFTQAQEANPAKVTQAIALRKPVSYD